MKRVPLRSIAATFLICTIVGCGSGFEPAIPSLQDLAAAGGGGTSICCAPVGSVRTSLLDNAGFESALTGWEDWGNSSANAAAAHSGGLGLRVAGGSGGRGQEVIYRLKTGGTYLLKAYARAATTDQVYVGVKFYDNSNVLLGEEKVQVKSTDFSEYSVQFQVPESVSSAKIYAYKQNTSTTNADFDDYSLTMVGSPANPPMEMAVSNPSNFQPTGPASGWTMVLNDDFISGALSANWNTGFWFNYSINNELQAYRPENVQFASGTMKLLAESRATTATWGEAKNYASAAITTRDKFTFTFGVAEARVRIPKGKGLYAQFWMLPNEKRSPPEIDVMGINGADPTTSHFTYDWMDDNGAAHGQPMTASRGDLSADFHTYTLEWLPDHISYYIDGVLLGTYRGDFVLRDPAFLILNLVVGGDVAGSPDGTTGFPKSMDVDYIRVWQKPL